MGGGQVPEYPKFQSEVVMVLQKVGTFGYFWVLFGTFGYFWVMVLQNCGTFGYFWVLLVNKIDVSLPGIT